MIWQRRTKRFFSGALIITCIMILICNAIGQNTQDTISNFLYGNWFLKPTTPINADTLTFKKISFYPMNWGPQIQILQNEKFVDTYGAKCGNDNSIHSDKGSWKFSFQTMLFETTIDIDKQRGKKFKVISVNADELVLLSTP
jgi:hypothetical protein